LIKEAKDLLEKIIKDRIPGIAVVRSFADEKHAITARTIPFIALITKAGNFDKSTAQTVRYFDGNKEYQQRYVRGDRNLPVQIRCWAESEDEADRLFSRILPAIPSQWGYDGFARHIEIEWEEHSDSVKVVEKRYLSVAQVLFHAAAAMEPGEIPFFKEVVVQEGEIINQEG
jgi:hypothetical protein